MGVGEREGRGEAKRRGVERVSRRCLCLPLLKYDTEEHNLGHRSEAPEPTVSSPNLQALHKHVSFLIDVGIL